jgi:hypothetical protein
MNFEVARPSLGTVYLEFNPGGLNFDNGSLYQFKFVLGTSYFPINFPEDYLDLIKEQIEAPTINDYEIYYDLKIAISKIDLLLAFKENQEEEKEIDLAFNFDHFKDFPFDQYIQGFDQILKEQETFDQNKKKFMETYFKVN